MNALRWRKMACVILGTTFLAPAILAASASAFDRQPVSISGLVPDNFGQSTTRAGQQLEARYPGIRADYCMGVTMLGYPAATSSFVVGLTRYWDKLACVGYTYSTGKTIFALVYDAKGPHAWIIYRLRGVPVSALEQGL